MKPGERWLMRDTSGDPFREPLTATILELRGDWVQFYVGEHNSGISRCSRMVKDFLESYDKVGDK